MASIAFVDYEECTWKEMTLSFSGADVGGIRGLKYSISSDDEPLHAKGAEPISIQSGNITYEGSIKVLKSVVDALQVAAKAVGASSILGIRFTITVTYLPSDDETRPLMTDSLLNCKISKLEKGWDQGAKHMDVELPIKFTKLVTVP